MATRTDVHAAPREHRLLGYLGLFSSMGTLLCCALPSIFVLLGLGATMASFLSAAPWLVTMSQHKTWTFAIAGLLIASNFYYVYHLAPRLALERETCAPGEEAACRGASRMSRVVLWLSAVLYLIGFATAYLLPLYFQWFDNR